MKYWNAGNSRLPIVFIFTTLFFGQIIAQDDHPIIPIWKNGAPGFEQLKNMPEKAKDWWVKNINNPTLTVFFPTKNMTNGTAVIICPGGGHSALVYNAEGKDAAVYLNSLGITAFVLKYRLFREAGSPYTMENTKQDIFRAIRFIKSEAKLLQIDTAKLGVMGFSAGGELAAWLSYHFNEGHTVEHDHIDSFYARPAFQILIYPGPLAVPKYIPNNAPPTFLLASNGDTCCSESIVQLMMLHRKAGVPVEIHLFQFGSHAFNMGKRSEYITLKNWPYRLSDWMNDNGWLHQ